MNQHKFSKLSKAKKIIFLNHLYLSNKILFRTMKNHFLKQKFEWSMFLILSLIYISLNLFIFNKLNSFLIFIFAASICASAIVVDFEIKNKNFFDFFENENLLSLFEKTLNPIEQSKANEILKFGVQKNFIHKNQKLNFIDFREIEIEFFRAKFNNY